MPGNACWRGASGGKGVHSCSHGYRRHGTGDGGGERSSDYASANRVDNVVARRQCGGDGAAQCVASAGCINDGHRWCCDLDRCGIVLIHLGAISTACDDDDTNAWKSFRNLTHVHCLHVGELNTYDVLNNDVIVFTEETLPTGEAAVAAAGSASEVSSESADSDDSADSIDSADSVDSGEEEE